MQTVNQLVLDENNMAFHLAPNSANQHTMPIATIDDEMKMLKEQATQIQLQLEAIQKHIQELKK